MRPNTEIHKAFENSGVKKWEVAERLGVADTTFSRWLRRELSEPFKAEIFESIKDLKEEGKCTSPRTGNHCP